MRGAVLSEGGTSILALQSSSDNGQVSRIVPFISEGAGVTLTRGDIHYVVTEYGIAYLHGKNIRERAMDLIAIAHPKFRPWLLEKAKELGLIYQDQVVLPGDNGEYPEGLETYRTTDAGVKLLLRPVKICDEPLLKDLFYALSDESRYRRFITYRKDMPHERLQGFLVIDYQREMEILAVVDHKGQEELVGIGQYSIDEFSHLADVAFIVRDDYQNKGVGQVLLSYLIHLANKQGLRGFTADVLVDNKAMLHLFEKMGFDILKQCSSGVYELKLLFRVNKEKGGE
jgi:RimJ/RimL family protein N-acetyltransferase